MRIAERTDKNVVVLVSPASPRFPLIGEPHGIAAISGHLKGRFPEATILSVDLQVDQRSKLVRPLFLTRHTPAIVGVSLKLRTLESAAIIYDYISNIPKEHRPLCIFGGCLANINPSMVLRRFPDSVLGLGEGELPMEGLYRYANGELPFESVRNLAYLDGEIRFSERSCLAEQDMRLPDRSRSLSYHDRGGEVYTEASRGCPYGKCAICGPVGALRCERVGLRWRIRPTALIIDDLCQLEAMGIQTVTFADEEFLGLGMPGIDRAGNLASAIIDSGISIQFRINARIDSIARQGDPGITSDKKYEVLRLLKKAGLVKIFLGLESGSPTQLQRYNKGFTLEDFIVAKARLSALGIPYEVGFIPLDPLASLREVAESLAFLRKHNLTRHVSSVFKELRVLHGTPYVNQVRKGVLGVLDDDSQEYQIVRYYDPRVGKLAAAMRPWKAMIYKLEYALRIATQYEDTPERTHVFRAITRLRYCEMHQMESLMACLLSDGTLSEGHGTDYGRRQRAIVGELRGAIVGGTSLAEEIDVYLAVGQAGC